MKPYIFLLPAALLLVACAVEQPKAVSTTSMVPEQQDQVQQARQLFSGSEVSDVRLLGDNASREGWSVQALDEGVDLDKGIVVRLEGDLEWPLPYDKGDLGGEVRGKYAIVVFDKETGRFTYIKMSREKL